MPSQDWGQVHFWRYLGPVGGGCSRHSPGRGVEPCQVLGSIGAYLFPFYHLYLYSFALIFKEISFLFPLFLSLSSSPAFLTLLLSAPDLPPALALCPFPTVFLRTSSQGVHPRLGGVSWVLRGGVGAPSHLWVHPARGRGRTRGSQPPLAGWRSLPAKTRTLSRPSHICSMYRLQGVSEPSAPFLLAAEDWEENQGP